MQGWWTAAVRQSRQEQSCHWWQIGNACVSHACFLTPDPTPSVAAGSMVEVWGRTERWACLEDVGDAGVKPAFAVLNGLFSNLSLRPAI